MDFNKTILHYKLTHQNRISADIHIIDRVWCIFQMWVIVDCRDVRVSCQESAESEGIVSARKAKDPCKLARCRRQRRLQDDLMSRPPHLPQMFFQDH